MAKENNLHPVVLFGISSLLLSAGNTLTSFPVSIFIGFAPLVAIADSAQEDSVFERTEWVLMALVFYFISIHSFDTSFLAPSVFYAILFTGPFVLSAWMKQIFGLTYGKIFIVPFWLAIEYIILKFQPGNFSFLADALRFRPEWMFWNIYTGYLGASGWILITNLLAFQAFLSRTPFKWYWILLFTMSIIGPVIYSFLLDNEPITRKDLMNLYRDKVQVADVTYLARGELTVRVSALISLFAIVIAIIKRQAKR